MIYLLIFVSLLVSELAYFRIADYFNIIDKPNERSSHTSITLRGGGVIFYMGVLLYFLLEGFQYPWFFAGLTLISFVSFADDVRPQSFKLRLAVHFTAMALMFYQWGLFSDPWYFTIIALVVCTGILNAYNFMDGINGITGGYSLVVVSALWYINRYQVLFVDTKFLYVLLLALIVFLFFNFRTKAKCFAGDVGAISMSFILVFLLGKLIIKTGDYSYLVLLAVYGVDTILTIVHRIILKENIFEAHRKHLFQIMANELNIPHVVVSTIYMALQALIAVGLFVFFNHKWLFVIFICVSLSVVYLLVKMKYYKLHKT
ncbi:MAG: MraY family glycosyltransferase [Microbacter sp.]